MAYAAPADLNRHLGKFVAGFTATSVPSTNDAPTFLDDIAGEIDGILNARGIATPVTIASAPQSFLDFLKVTNAIGAAAQIVAALFPHPAGPSGTTYDEFLDQQYEQRLKGLRNGEGIPDVVLPGGTGGSLARSFWTTNPTDDDGNEHAPTFRRDMQW